MITHHLNFTIELNIKEYSRFHLDLAEACQFLGINKDINYLLMFQ